jgi:hypothetical protein
MKVPVYEKKASRRDLIRHIEELRKMNGQLQRNVAILYENNKNLHQSLASVNNRGFLRRVKEVFSPTKILVEY